MNGYIASNYLSDASKLEENVIVDGYAAWYTISIHVALALDACYTQYYKDLIIAERAGEKEG